MNAGLLMGEELLKKTGFGNLFTVFGEPDVSYWASAGATWTGTTTRCTCARLRV
jgi:hypothetical protein